MSPSFEAEARTELAARGGALPSTEAGRALYELLRDRNGLIPILSSIIAIERESATVSAPNFIGECRVHGWHQHAFPGPHRYNGYSDD